jgi:hypothetical protein
MQLRNPGVTYVVIAHEFKGLYWLYHLRLVLFTVEDNEEEMAV